MSRQHVVEVASGRRPGRSALVATIEKYRERARQSERPMGVQQYNDAA